MAMLLAVLMIVQILPAQVLAETLYSPSVTLGDQVQLKSLGNETYPSLYDVTIRYKHEDDTDASPQYLAKYVDGTEYSVSSPVVTGYAPAAEDLVLTGTVSGADVVRTVTYHPSSKQYLVRHWQQKIGGGSEFNDTNFQLIETDSPSGSVGSLTAAMPKNYTGFTVQPYTDVVIPADGQAVVDLYYTRNLYSIYFHSMGGSVIAPITRSYESPVGTIPAPARAGYVFQGWDWNGDGVFNTSDVPPAAMPASNITVNAIWGAGQANYKIVYWAQNANDDGYSYLGVFQRGPVATESAAYAEALSATASSDYYWGKLINPSANFETDFWNIRSYFRTPVIESKTVDGDGTTVVNVRYDRKTYNLVFRTPRQIWVNYRWYDSGVYEYRRVPGIRLGQDIDNLWLDMPIKEDGSYTDTGFTYEEGTTTFLAGITRNIYNKEGPFRKFHSWSDNGGTSYVTRQYVLTTSMIANAADGGNAVITAGWTTSTMYDRHAIYLIKETDGQYTTYSTFSTSQQWGASLNPKEFKGLTYSSGDPVNYSSTTSPREYPAGSGNYYNYIFVYTRNNYQLTFNANQGQFTDGTTVYGPRNIPYGVQLQTADLPSSSPERTGYTFIGWYVDTYGQTEFSLYDVNNNLITMPPNNLLLYAGWQINSYPVTWYIDKDAYDAGTPHLGTETINYNQPSNLPAEPVREGCTFQGWYTMTDGVETRYIFGSPVTSEVKAYAKWASSGSVIYTVKHLRLSDSSELVPPQTYVVSQGETATFNAQTLYGYLPDALSKPSSAADENKVVTFWYKPSQEGLYRVFLRERETNDELGDPPHYYEDHPSNSYRVVTELNTTIIPGYNRVNLYGQVTMQTTNPGDNAITFWYDPVLRYESQNVLFGSVSNSSEAVKAQSGEPAGATAVANAGYVFKGWEDEAGNIVSTSPTFVPTIATTGDPAQFVPQTYTATFTASVTATKIWAGNGPEPFPTIRFQLMRNIEGGVSEPVPDVLIKTVPYVAGETVKYVTWDNLSPQDGQGNPYTFTVKETRADGTDYTPPNYAKEESGTTVTNTWKTRSFKVQKVWDGGTPPAEGVEIVLLRDNAVYKTVTLTAAVTEHTWTGLPVEDPETGLAYAYRVEEPTVPDGYQRTISGPTADHDAVITNKYYPVSLKAVKILQNPGDLPAAMTEVTFSLELNQDGQVYETFELSSPVPLSPMVKEYTDLPRYKQTIDVATGDASLHEHEYTITETVIPTKFLRVSVSYNQAAGQWEVVNQYNEGLFNAQKVWDILPEPESGTTVTFGLYRILEKDFAHGMIPPTGFEYMTGRDVVLNGETDPTIADQGESSPWAAQWKNLDGDDPAGNIYRYHVLEKTGPADYDVISSASTKVENRAKTLNFYAAKQWVNGVNSRPANVTLTLKRSVNGVEDAAFTDTLVLDGTAGNASALGFGQETASSDGGSTWNARWGSLPRFDANEDEYAYSVSESAVPNFISSGPVLVNGVHTITNTYDQPRINVIGYKNWVNGETLRGQIVVKLWNGAEGVNGLLDGTGEVDETDATGDGELAPVGDIWRYIWKNVPEKDINGNPITYTVREITNLEPAFTSSESGLTVTNTYNVPKADISGTKTWVDGQTVRPDNLTMQLWRKIVVGGATEVDEYVPGTDYAISTESDFQTATITKTWAQQPVTDDMGRTYTYYVKEGVGTGASFAEGLPAGSDFILTGGGTLDLTNTYQPPLTAEDVIGKKTWVNGYVQRHTDLTMQLWRRVEGVVGSDEYITGSDQTILIGVEPDDLSQYTFQHNWGKQPAADSKGRAYVYYIKEGVGTGTSFAEGLPAGSNFLATGQGTLEMTNTYVVPRSSQEGTKIWLAPDGNPLPADSKYRTNIYLRLYRSYVDAAGVTHIEKGHGLGADDILVTGSSDGIAKWENSPNNLPLTTIDGRPYSFWVVEVPFAGSLNESWMPVNFIKTESGMTVTNRMIPPTAKIIVKKAYLNGAGDTPAQGDVDGPAQNKLKFDFTAVDAYGEIHQFSLAPGESIEFYPVPEGIYQITEVGTHGYEPSYSPDSIQTVLAGETLTAVVTNNNTELTTTDFEVSKTWIGGPAADHEVTINLYRGIEGQTTLQLVSDVSAVVTPATPDNPGEVKFTYTWEGLPLYNSYGLPYIYSAEEAGLTEVVGEGGAISYELTKNGNTYLASWSGSLYDSTDPLKFTNTYQVPTESITATKHWVDVDGVALPDGTAVPAVELKLLRREKATDDWAIVPAADGGGLRILAAGTIGGTATVNATWTNVLLTSQNGTAYSFAVEETAVPNGYTVGYGGNAADGFTVTNTYDGVTNNEDPDDPDNPQEPVTITVKKIWQDAGGTPITENSKLPLVFRSP